LVESALDVLYLDQLGYAEEFDIGATIGAGVSVKQILNMMGWGTILIGLDSDGAGQEGTKKILDGLKGSDVRLIDWGMVRGKDPGELNSEQIHVCIEGAKSLFQIPFSWGK
jgi:hypothetical protein